MLNDDPILDLIESIYESALRPEKWLSTIDSIADAMGGSSSVLILLDERGLDAKISAAHRLNPTDMQVYADYYADKDEVVRAAAAVPVGKPFTVPLIVSEELYLASEHFNDFLAPQDIRHIACTQLIRDKTGIGYLSVFRPDRRENFTNDELRLLSLLSPHIQRALQLGWHLERLEANARSRALALDQLSTALFLVDGEGRVIFANGTGEALLREQDGLCYRGDRLAGATAADTHALRRLIAGAARTALGDGDEAGGALALARPSGKRPLNALVSPSARGGFGLADGGAAAIVFVDDPERQARPREEVLATLYCLTPAEARLAAALAGGLSLKDYAEQAAITMNTARWTLKQAFAKTETRSQAALVRLLLKGPLALVY